MCDVKEISILVRDCVLSYVFASLSVYMPVCRLEVDLQTGIFNGKFLGWF